MFERFSREAREVIAIAERLSDDLKHDYIGTEHLLLSILRIPRWNEAERVLRALGTEPSEARALVSDCLRGVPQQANLPADKQFTSRAKRALAMAENESMDMRENVTGTVHLLLGILRDPESEASKVLKTLGIDYSVARAEYLHPPQEMATADRRVRVVLHRNAIKVTINAEALVSLAGYAFEGEQYALSPLDEHVITVTLAD